MHRIVGGALLGARIEQSGGCSGEILCGVGGAMVGGLFGMVTWSLVDVFAIGPTTWRANNSSGRAFSLDVRPLVEGGAALTLAGRM
jgi:hypothetical protein